MIQVAHLSKQFSSKRVLQDVSFQIAEGECAGLAGPNGAGKTTLLRILATLIRAEKGSLNLAGFRLPEEAAQLRGRLGMVAHQTWIFNDLTARQNLFFYSRLYGISHPTARIEEVLARVGLGNMANREVRTFSRGMQQRLSIARALLNNPSILLLDEPYTGLDDDAVGIMDKILVEAQREGCTILLASHDLQRLEKHADRFLILDFGILRGDLTRNDLAGRGFPTVYRDLITSPEKNL
jgi:heme exporter protein A